MATDQFCLRWNNFQVNITSALESLKCDEDLVDVTLTCDGQNVKAHKVILSACSPYFRNVFKENPCQHPVVILKDVKYEDVTALLNFMYQGEVYITQDRLAPFLHTAELLQVRGLAGATNPFKESQTPALLPQQQLQQPPQQPKLQSQLQQPKVKKSVPHISGGQLRRVTPPLSVSPSLPVSNKSHLNPYRTSKTPLLSPSSKDAPATSTLGKEKSKETHLLPLAREAEVDPSTKSACPISLPVSSHQSSATYPSLNEHPCPTYSPALSDQSSLPALTSPAAFQQQSRETSPLHSSLQFSTASNDQSSSQPSSPQPPAAKRRKAFPRRVSSSHISTEEPISPGENSEEINLQSKPSEEYSEFERIDVAVKQERMDDNPQDVPGFDEDMSLQQNSCDAEEMLGVPAGPTAGQEDDKFAMEHDSRDDGTVEGNSEGASQSLLLRSLAGGETQNMSQSDGIISVPKQEVLLHDPPLQEWSGNYSESADVYLPNTNWDATVASTESPSETIVDNFHMPPMQSVNVAPVTQLHHTVKSPVFSALSTRLANNRLLYQRRKHVWRSRRPVQCPNCHKTISMAYNLKNHLATCFKRNGVRCDVRDMN